MQHTIDRRRFLSGCAALTAGAALASSPALAIEPIKRNGTPKFKFSLAAYSYRSLLGGKDPQLTMSDFVNDCAEFGLEGTELTSYYFPADVKPAYLRDLKQQCFRLGLDVSGTAVGNDFGKADEDQRREQIESVKKWVDNAAILGAPVIRIFAGHVPKDVAPETAHKWMVEGMQECCDYAGKHGVFLALENHGGPTATPDGLLSLVHAVKSPWFGVNLDSGNFHTEDPYADLARIAPYAVNAQIKVVVDRAGAKEPADYARMAEILRAADYRGYIVLEYEEQGDVRSECKKHLQSLREAFA
ncbi:MAG: sugar phosphate isomerase/epimerase family protein [Pirellulaceae bacterium]